MGTFLSKDRWEGDETYSQSMNSWAYVLGNPVNYGDPSGNWPDEMLESKLGENWQSVYFFGDCHKKGIFAGRDNLYDLLVSDNTYDVFVLDFIGEAFKTAWVMSLVGLPFDANSSIDAIGLGIHGSASGTPFYGGGALEGLLNTASGEVSVFIAGGGGASFGGKVGVTAGPHFIRNLPTNADYRNYFGSVSLSGGAGPGITAEGFWGAPKVSPMIDGTSGVFVGGGFVEGAAITGGYAFFYELFRVDTEGYHLLPDPFDYQPENIIPIIRDDIIGTLQDYSLQLLDLRPN